MLLNKMSGLFWSGLFVCCITSTPTVLAQNQPVITKNYAAEYVACKVCPVAKRDQRKTQNLTGQIGERLVLTAGWIERDA